MDMENKEMYVAKGREGAMGGTGMEWELALADVSFYM